MTTQAMMRAVQDADLKARIEVCIYHEAFSNATLKDTVYATQVRSGFVGAFTSAYYAVADAVQVAYQTGIDAGRGSPGYDKDVVTDQMIKNAVVANWPPDPPPPTGP